MVSHRVATSLLYSLSRLQPRQDEHTWGCPLHTPCTATRSPTDHWGAGPAPRPPGAKDGSAQVSPVRLRRVLDPLRCARQDAAPLEASHPEQCDERLVAMGRLSHACLPYTTLGMCRTTPLHHIVPLSFPGGTSPVIAATLFARQGERGPPAIPACTKLQRRRPTMEIAVAQQFLREHENAVLATWRRDGRVQMSPVTVGLDGAGRAIISSNETTYKVRNLRRDPRAALCIFVEAFRGPWVQIEGTAEIVTLPAAMEPLVDYYRRLAGEHPDWDDYRRAMTADRRALIRITIERAGPDHQG